MLLTWIILSPKASAGLGKANRHRDALSFLITWVSLAGGPPHRTANSDLTAAVVGFLHLLLPNSFLVTVCFRLLVSASKYSTRLYF